MTIAFHPDISTLMAWSAGTLDEPFAVVVSTHMAMCEACRETARRTDLIGGALLKAETAEPMSDGALERLLEAADDERIDLPEPRGSDSVDPSVPQPLARYLPDGLDAVKWKFSGPGVATCELPTGTNANGRLMLLRVGAGKRVPEHGHGGQELTLILRGAYGDRFGRFAAGDLADHDEDVEHQPIAEPGEDCICLVAVDARLNFRSRVIRTLQPLFGF
ncbi:transcriptional regulator [Arsenicitalea aurantiaca]|uniref:Transcriptional regulator n=1 Tax=Arsenicitalea aurantiaca TaxID=1783274 RepID=A0A433XEZ5_9HYPH|nr:ChrR family anti-sigma-E factor [Arsenicitalea aurantiaca]RUT32574.1 transcriptional regulator [Arsenicitalea aurantiaca]